MKKFFLVLVSAVLLASCASNQSTRSVDSTNHSVTNNTTHKKEETSLSSSKKKESIETTQSSLATTNSAEAKYPKITKMLLNGKSWYEGNSTGVENQPRQGFTEDKLHDLFGNKLEYEIIIDDNEQTYRVLDYRKNELVDIKLKTKIKVNKPTVDGTYRDVFYYLYYKYDGTLMIAREGAPSEDSDLTSYPLEEINIWEN
ncbi:membrane lipoprotein lipid attachment site-containing protein [Enterococcus caccae]|uniref:Lipoprotein n=1 Tax=Enterococcus caccae ATCC BAA-1240 TaxID=1158612 RepID=R3WCC9_9ENTE|nr:membrane lipoprotein lipid attachment site-containing protein [Enterococcus caccae]EOL45132.1 hypothetical protein UC7_01938 [Enterococcus caccae ATCC BAA-1240]EOT58539.1 hypothetical protein I580_02710 [Enterococcus caccae ATCC BAA-1240]